jgi:hypothetical protein
MYTPNNHVKYFPLGLVRIHIQTKKYIKRIERNGWINFSVCILLHVMACKKSLEFDIEWCSTYGIMISIPQLLIFLQMIEKAFIFNS